MKNALKKHLKAYASLTAAFGASSMANAAIQITTFSKVLPEDDLYSIDVNGDGQNDFEIFSRYESGAFGTFMREITLSYLNSNGVYANSSLEVIASSSGAVINSALSFGSGYRFARVISYPQSDGRIENTYQFASFVDDKFAAIKFDITGSTHYGWLRFRKIGTGLGDWILVDAGWEDEPDTDLIIDAPKNSVSVNEVEPLDFSITAPDNYLSITTEHLNTNLEVFDINGKHVYSQKITSKETKIPYKFPKGIYVVRLFTKEKAVSRKVYF